MSRKSASIVLLLALLVGFVAYAPSTASANTAATNDRAGISYPLSILQSSSDAELDRLFQEAAGTGAKYVRLDLPWSDVQTSNTNQWNWSKPDKYINKAISNGLTPILIAYYTPSWASGHPDSNMYPPVNAQDYYKFLYQAGKHYIPKGVTVFELWNEPNITNFWKSAPNVSDYVNKILIPGSNGVRQAAAELGASVTVLTAGTAPNDGTNGDILPLDFITGIYANGGKNYFDAVGHHPYTWPDSPTTPGNWNQFLQTQAIYKVMSQNGDGGKKIWATEIGFPTSSPSSRGISELMQADYMSQFYYYWNMWSFAGPALWYSYKDDGTNQNDPEHNFGIVRNDWSKKQSYWQFKTEMKTPNQTGYIRIKNAGTGKYLFQEGTQVSYGDVPESDKRSWWRLEDYDGAVRIRNYANWFSYMNIEHQYNNVESYHDIYGDSYSSEWIVQDYNGNKRIMNKWLGTYLNTQNLKGYAECSAISAGSLSSQWIFQSINYTDGNYIRIKNAWTGQYLYQNGTTVSYGNMADTDLRSWWRLEAYDGAVRIRNYATWLAYMNVEQQHDYLESYHDIWVDAYSSQWIVQDYNGHKRIMNRWLGTYLNTQNLKGYAEYSAIPASSLSSQWIFEAVS